MPMWISTAQACAKCASRSCSRSFTSPCSKVLWRSCWNPPQEVLALRSWRSSALLLVWKFFWGCSWKVLVWRSCELLYIDLYRRSLAIRSNLISYCFIATVARIWNIDFLTPTVFGVSRRCNFWIYNCHPLWNNHSKMGDPGVPLNHFF